MSLAARIGFALAALLLAAWTGMAAIAAPASAQVAFENLRFFESGFRPVPQAQRRYVSLLPRSATRFVYWEMTLGNRLQNQRDHSHRIVATWYKEDGTRLGQTNQTLTVKAAWPSAWASHGWGFREAGRWQPGLYRVDISVDGRLFARRSFLVYDDSRIDPDQPHLAFTELRLFESAFQPPPLGQRTYKTAFKPDQTRYIYAEIRARNLLYGQRAHRPIILLRYFSPTGSFFGEVILNKVDIQPNWREAVVWGGRGWRQPGRWRPGRYRVEAWFGNFNKVGETSFTVGATPAATRPDATPRTSPRATPGDEEPGEQEVRPDEQPDARRPGPSTRRTPERKGDPDPEDTPPAPDATPDRTPSPDARPPGPSTRRTPDAQPDRQPDTRPDAPQQRHPKDSPDTPPRTDVDRLPTLPSPDTAPKQPANPATPPAPESQPSAPQSPSSPPSPTKKREVKELEGL